jgi:glutaredoxin
MASNYYLDIVYLEGCPHSRAAYELITEKKINHKLINVTHLNKDKYKTRLISTFPQIYLKKINNNGSLLLGGNSDINEINNIIKNNKLESDSISKINNKYTNIKKKLSLRIYQLFNSQK